MVGLAGGKMALVGCMCGMVELVGGAVRLGRAFCYSRWLLYFCELPPRLLQRPMRCRDTLACAFSTRWALSRSFCLLEVDGL